MSEITMPAELMAAVNIFGGTSGTSPLNGETDSQNGSFGSIFGLLMANAAQVQAPVQTIPEMTEAKDSPETSLPDILSAALTGNENAELPEVFTEKGAAAFIRTVAKLSENDGEKLIQADINALWEDVSPEERSAFAELLYAAADLSEDSLTDNAASPAEIADALAGLALKAVKKPAKKASEDIPDDDAVILPSADIRLCAIQTVSVSFVDNEAVGDVTDEKLSAQAVIPKSADEISDAGSEKTYPNAYTEAPYPLTSADSAAVTNAVATEEKAAVPNAVTAEENSAAWIPVTATENAAARIPVTAKETLSVPISMTAKEAPSAPIPMTAEKNTVVQNPVAEEKNPAVAYPMTAEDVQYTDISSAFEKLFEAAPEEMPDFFRKLANELKLSAEPKNPPAPETEHLSFGRQNMQSFLSRLSSPFEQDIPSEAVISDNTAANPLPESTLLPEGDDVSSQIIRRIDLYSDIFKDNFSEKEIEMELSPEELGSLDIRIKRSEKGFEITFTAEKAEAAELISQKVSELEEAMASRGIALKEISVSRQIVTNEADGSLTGNSFDLGSGAQSENSSGRHYAGNGSMTSDDPSEQPDETPDNIINREAKLWVSA